MAASDSSTNAAPTALNDLMASCLEAARVEVVRRLAEKSLPTSLVAQQLVIIDNEEGTGWQSAWREVRRSSIRSLSVAGAISDTSVLASLLGLRDQLLPLAAYLETTTQLGTPPGVGFLPQLEGVEGVLGRVVTPLANRYLMALEDLAIPDAEEVARLADELSDLARRGRAITDLSEVVLSGITMPEPIGSYRQVSLRTLSEAERGSILRNQMPFSYEDLATELDFAVPRDVRMFSPTVLLTTRAARPPEAKSPQSQLAARVALALILDGFDIASPGILVRSVEPKWMANGHSMPAFPVQDRFPSTPRAMTGAAFVRVVDLAHKMPDFGEEESTREQVVLSRLLKGCGVQFGGFLDLAISLEAALLGGIGNKTELSYRFALYGARFLADERDPQTTFEQLKRIYRVRSNLVHGAPVKTQERFTAEREAADLAKAIARRSLESGWLQPDRLDEELVGISSAVTAGSS